MENTLHIAHCVHYDVSKACTRMATVGKQATKNLQNVLTKPNGPIFGANDEVAPTSPPTQRR